MLLKQEEMIYEHFPELVTKCNLVSVMHKVSLKNPLIAEVLAFVKPDEDCRHNNRLILFNLMKMDSDEIFYDFAESLRECGYGDIASKLENRPLEPSPLPIEINTYRISRIIFDLIVIIILKITAM